MEKNHIGVEQSDLVDRSRVLGAQLPTIIDPSDVTDELREIIIDYNNTETNVQVSKGNFPKSADQWGCVSAAAAFALNNMSADGEIVDSSFFDREIARQSETPGSVQNVTLWLLSRGFQVEEFTWGDETISDVKLPLYFNGELTFEEFLKYYEKDYGALSSEHVDLLREHLDKRVGPGVLQVKNEYPVYIAAGKLREHEIVASDVTKHIITQTALGRTVLLEYSEPVYTEEGEKMAEYKSHCVAIYRPQNSSPITVFSPDVEESGIRIFSKFDEDDIAGTAITFIAVSPKG